MNAKLSGISGQMTRLLPKCVLNLADSLERCTRSMTKMMSAQAKSSGVTGLAASWLKPAEDVSIPRSEEHTSELQSLMRISYAVFCLKKTKKNEHTNHNNVY